MSFSFCCVYRCGAVQVCCVIFPLLCVQVWGSPSLLCYFPSAVCTGVGQSKFAVLFSLCCVYRCGAVRVCCVIFLLLCVQVWGSQSLLCPTWWTSSVSSSPQREETSSKVWLAGHAFCAQRKTQPLECRMFSHTLYSVCPPPKSELK